MPGETLWIDLGSHVHIRSVLDHPADLFAGVGRELQVAADVLGGLGLQAPQGLLGPTEGALAVIEVLQP